MKRIINAAMALALVGALTLLFSHDAAAQQKGTGAGKGAAKRGANFVDQNGDGICDNFVAKTGTTGGNGTGVCDGTGPKGKGAGMKAGNGTGTGAGTCTGVCDGTGPKGSMGQGHKGGRK